MLFPNKKLLLKIENLEKELAEFHRIQHDLKEEMNYFCLDTKGTIKEVNNHFLHSCGYAENEVLNKNIKDLIVNDSMKKLHCQNMLAAIKVGKHWHGAIQIVAKSGDELWFRSIVQPVVNDANNEIRIAVYSSELTNTIVHSREQQDMLGALDRSSAVIEFTLDGIILNANNNFLEGMLYAKNQIIGKHHEMFCSPEEVKSAAYKNFWKRLNKGEFISSRFKRFDSYRNPVWLEASYNPIYDESGVLYKVVKFATIITEQMTREFAVADTAAIAFDISKKTDENTAKGISVLQSTIATMEQLSTQMREASAGVFDLDEQSQKVAVLVSNISSIADQTNLLALNAAIEAARAGDQGRGFAVVADEVRQLALRTSSTTVEIVEVVNDNKKLTENAVFLIEQSLAKVQDALDLSNNAGAVMDEIQIGARQIVNAVGQFNDNL